MRAETYNGSVRIEVADTGVGRPEDARLNVSKPFFRAPGVATQHGEPSTGLGLAVAKQLAELQQGRLTLAGNEPEGTTVTVTLPRG